ncbi:hypothetical protein ACFOEK_01965 [Litoribrevibacter euphylliae]|uniref:Uncharacterized protein n=1 Tax=Litoribrevibacter euphylliae TaxID=1834034 RepID=A0ABV7HE10_9GAMM
MRKASALTLCIVSIASILVTKAYLTFIFQKFILSGHSIGVYGIYMYLAVLLVTALLWWVSFRNYKNRVMAIVYWVVALALMPVVIFQPTWWAAPY